MLHDMVSRRMCLLSIPLAMLTRIKELHEFLHVFLCMHVVLLWCFAQSSALIKCIIIIICTVEIRIRPTWLDQ